MERAMKATAYVFIATKQPKRVVQELRELPGILKADGLFGTPDVMAIIEAGDIGAVDAVIDRIAEMPEVLSTESKVARWIEAAP
jgi:DNA-binding Lrp family transcriptional regulator